MQVDMQLICESVCVAFGTLNPKRFSSILFDSH